MNEILTASNTIVDEDGLGTITYHWLRNGTDIGSTGSSYLLTDADMGKSITVDARYTDSTGVAERVSSLPLTASKAVSEVVVSIPDPLISITEDEVLLVSDTESEDEVKRWKRLKRRQSALLRK